MAAPARGSSTSETQLHIQWVHLTTHAETGGAIVTSYHLEWDAGNGQTAWSDLVGYTSDYTSSEFIATTGVAPAGEYALRVRAYNAHGWGADSEVTVIVASAAPD